MSEMSSTSVSAAAIFSAEESCGRLPKRKDILDGSFSSFVDNFHVWRVMPGLYRELELHVSPIKKGLGVEVLRWST